MKEVKQKNNHKHHHHGWMMLICILPLLLIFFYSIFSDRKITGNYTWGFLLICIVMHGVMMFGMKGHHHEESSVEEESHGTN